MRTSIKDNLHQKSVIDKKSTPFPIARYKSHRGVLSVKDSHDEIDGFYHIYPGETVIKKDGESTYHANGLHGGTKHKRLNIKMSERGSYQLLYY